MATIGISNSKSLGLKKRPYKTTIRRYLSFGLRQFFRYSKEEKYFNIELGRETIFIGLLTSLITAYFILPW